MVHPESEASLKSLILFTKQSSYFNHGLSINLSLGFP